MSFWTSCAVCNRIRLFLAMAIPLIVLIGVRPEAAQRLAGMIPTADVIGYMIAVAAVLEFARRWFVWQNIKKGSDAP